MAGRVSVNSQKLNQIPPLPVPMTNGTIEWSESFEQLPTGTLTYQGVTESQLLELQSIYTHKTPITLGGIPLEVDTFTSNKTNYPVNNRYGYEVTISLRSRWTEPLERNIPIASIQQSDGYANISDLANQARLSYTGPNGRFLATNGGTITLQSALNEITRINAGFVRYSDNTGVRIIGLDNTNFYQFAQQDAIEDSRTVGALPKFYQAEVTGEFVEIESGKPYSPVELDKPFIPRTIRNRTVEEGLQNINPPNEAEKLKDLSLNFDVSGEKRVYKKLYYTNDRLTREEQFIYGYAYSAKDILIQANPQKYEGDPRAYWRQIEYRDTQYIFERIPITVTANFYDAVTNRPLVTVLHPDYRIIASYDGGLYAGYNTKYLIEKKTTGWRLARFAIETLGDGGEYDRISINNSNNPNVLYRKQLTQFRQVPLSETTRYKLLGERTAYNLTNDSTFGSNEYALATAPFDVQFLSYYEAIPRIRKLLPVRTNAQGLPDDYRFALVIPKIDFVEPFLVMEEETKIDSFAQTPHPSLNPLVSQRANAPQIPPLTTGIESYNGVQRSLVGYFMPSFGYFRSTHDVEYDRCGFVRPPKEEYRETIVEFNSSDPEFRNNKQRVETKIVEGRPPTAESWQQEWERLERCDHKALLRSPSFIDRTRKYFATSDNPDLLDVGSQSFSYPQAQTSEQARIAVLTDLRIQTFQTITRNCRLTWFFPQIRAGDQVKIGQGEGAERVLSVSWSITVGGVNNLTNGQPLILSQGTNLQLGSDIPRTVTLNAIAQNARVSIFYGIYTYHDSGKIEFRNNRRNY